MAKTKANPPPPPTYSPTPEERAAIEKVFEERKIAPAPPLKVQNNRVVIDHPHEITGFLLMQNALGTSDSEFMLGLLKQLERATSGGPNVNETDLNFMVSVIKGIEPRDQIESMLAAQMAATHMAVMRFVQHLPLIESLPQQDGAERAINKFARTLRFAGGGAQALPLGRRAKSYGTTCIGQRGWPGDRRQCEPEPPPGRAGQCPLAAVPTHSLKSAGDGNHWGAPA
jgi:hypothetical protein